MIARRILLFTMSALLLSGLAIAQSRPAIRPPVRQQKVRPDPLRPNPNRLEATRTIEDMVESFYVSRFQAEMQVTDDQFARLLPTLRESIREQRQVAVRQNQARNQLRRRVLAGNASEDELRNAIRELDRLDDEASDSQRRLLASVDAVLTPVQQARFRVFRFQIEQRIRQLMQGARNP